mgnify:CR=1 FL=1
MDKKLLNESFIKLVQATLNRRHEMGLSINVSVDTKKTNQSIVFDLADLSKVQFVIILSGANSLNRDEYTLQIDKYRNALLDAKNIQANKFYLKVIFSEDLDGAEKKYYHNKYLPNSKLHVEILDKKDILNLSRAFNLDDLWLIENDNNDKELSRNLTSEFRKISSEDLIMEDLKLNVWWLNADEHEWKYIEGEIEYYPIKTLSKNDKIRTRNYFNQLNTGDLFLAYRRAPKQNLFGVYLMIPSEKNEHFAFTLLHEFNKKISWEGLTELTEFKESSIFSMKAQGSVYRIEKNLFIQIINKCTDIHFFAESLVEWIKNKANDYPKNTFKHPFNTGYINGVSNNRRTRSEAISTDYGLVDSLGFTKDVQSLAALIALKEMKPPLAIALFGKWGSGKSFFMNCLEQRIRELSKYQGFIEGNGNLPMEDEDDVFLSGIAHIRFNAWSYMDANLWAGLAHSLFEKLDQYITDNTKSELERLKIQVKINKRLEYLNNDIEKHENKTVKLESLKTQLERERNNQLLKWFKPKYDDKIRSFLKYNGLDDQQIELYLPSKLRKYVDKSISLISYLKGNAYQITIWLLSIIAVIWIVKGLVSPFIKESNLLTIMIKSVWANTLLSMIPVVWVALCFLIKRRTLILSLANLVIEEEALKKESSVDDELELTKKEIRKTNDLILELQENIEKEKENQSNLTELAIENLISEIPNNDGYVKYLGIITTIRKDFETLSELFLDKDKEINDTLNQKEKERIEELNKDRNEIKKAFYGKDNRKLDRIVLYIDDLDRCTDEKVLEVLQAVHLLMAFPLFTVIVGVDERSVHNALKYQQLKRYQNINEVLIEKNIKEIEPREYLEKIFQIPFQLPEASEEGVGQLIDDIIPNPQWDTSNQMGDFQMGDSVIQGTIKETPYIKEKEAVFSDSMVKEDVNNYSTISTIKPEEIRITKTEKEYLKLFAHLVGNNPRTIKRYINIFRIVKTHEQEAFQTQVDIVKIIFLLSMFIGYRRNWAVSIFKSDETQPIYSIALKLDQELFDFLDRQSKKDEIINQIIRMTPQEYINMVKFVERFSYKISLKPNGDNNN